MAYDLEGLDQKLQTAAEMNAAINSTQDVLLHFRRVLSAATSRLIELTSEQRGLKFHSANIQRQVDHGEISIDDIVNPIVHINRGVTNGEWLAYAADRIEAMQPDLERLRFKVGEAQQDVEDTYGDIIGLLIRQCNMFFIENRGLYERVEKLTGDRYVR